MPVSSPLLRSLPRKVAKKAPREGRHHSDPKIDRGMEVRPRRDAWNKDMEMESSRPKWERKRKFAKA